MSSVTLGCIVSLIVQIRQQEKEHKWNWLINAGIVRYPNVLYNIYIIWNSHWLLHRLGRYYAWREWKRTPHQSLWITMSLISIHMTHVPEFIQVISDTIWSTPVQNPLRTAIAVVNLEAVASAAIAPVLCMLLDLEHNHKIKNVVLE